MINLILFRIANCGDLCYVFLTHVQVLDLGFNGIRHLSNEAFTNNKLLTLLALDGNPLKTLSIDTFAHLNSTLRGLSFGGK